MAKRLVRARAADRDLFRATARRFLVAVQSAYSRLQQMPDIGVPRQSTRKGTEGARGQGFDDALGAGSGAG